MSKKTLVIGASTNPDRYSYKAINYLQRYNHEVVAIAQKNGEVNGLEFLTGFPEIGDIDTVALYINKEIQKGYYDYILSLRPKRIIFNPGTENSELEEMASCNDIEPVQGCVLVMLTAGLY
jgi:hypothetical protein